METDSKLSDFLERYPIVIERTRVQTNPYRFRDNPHGAHWCVSMACNAGNNGGRFVFFVSKYKDGGFPTLEEAIVAVAGDALTLERMPTLPEFLAEGFYGEDARGYKEAMFCFWIIDNLIRPGLKNLLGDAGYDELMKIMSAV